MFCISLNHRVLALSQVNLFGRFNSAGRIGGRLVAACEDGMMEIGESNTADGDPIPAFFEFVHDWGRMSRPVQFWIGGEASGSIELTVQMDGHEEKPHVMAPRLYDNGQHQWRTPARRDCAQGHYMRTRISNLGGADFSIDRVVCRPNYLAER